MKLVTVLGARPQFIKAATLSRLIRTDNSVEEIIVHTGQHYDANMSDIFFHQMQIPQPNYNLEIKGQYHGEMTGKMLEGIEKVISKEKPDLVMVYGDTNSTLAGSLAAKKMHVRVAHVEAGLRSFNMKMPEEINRILTDRISDLLFCPSQASVKNLEREGFQHYPCKIYDVGDIMKDVALFYRDKGVAPSFPIPKTFFLASIHRAENTDHPKRLGNILDAFVELSAENPIILPLHPRTKARLPQDFRPGNGLIICEPLGYLEMVYLLNRCSMVITDSGGLQKEAFYFSKFCVTVRDETEWTELVESGFNAIAGTERNAIIQAVKNFRHKSPPAASSLYGDGNTARKILEIIKVI
jgi:UDP-GlcNAc3NAcA epimerase